MSNAAVALPLPAPAGPVEETDRLEEDFLREMVRFALSPIRRATQSKRGRGVLQPKRIGPDGVAVRLYAIAWVDSRLRCGAYDPGALRGLRLALEHMSPRDVSNWVRAFRALHPETLP